MEMLILATATVLLTLSMQPTATVAPDPAELAASHQWVTAHLGGDELSAHAPFFSFVYDGKRSSELLTTWDLERTTRTIDENRTEYALAWSDPQTGLTVRCVGIAYRDYPNVEWTLYFKNTADKDSPILTDIRPLDI